MFIEKRRKLKKNVSKGMRSTRTFNKIVTVPTELEAPERAIIKSTMMEQLRRSNIIEKGAKPKEDGGITVFSIPDFDEDKTRSVLSILGSATRRWIERSDAEGNMRTPWMINGVDLSKFAAYDFYTSESGKARASVTTFSVGGKHVTSAYPIIADDEITGDKSALFLNHIKNITNEDTYLRYYGENDSDIGDALFYNSTGQTVYDSMMVYRDEYKNYLEMNNLRNASGSGSPTSRRNAIFEFLYLTLIASGIFRQYNVTEISSASALNTVSLIYAKLMSRIFGSLEMTRNGQTLHELELPVDVIFTLVASAINDLNIDDLGLSVSLGNSSTEYEHIIADDVTIDVKGMTLMFPDDLYTKRISYRKIFNMPVLLNINYEPDDIVNISDVNYVIRPANFVNSDYTRDEIGKVYLRVEKLIADDFIAQVKGYILGEISPSSNHPGEINVIPHGTSCQLNGFITVNTGQVEITESNLSDEASIRVELSKFEFIEVPIGSMNSQLATTDGEANTEQYSESSSYEGIPKFVDGTRTSFAGVTHSTFESNVLRAKFHNVDYMITKWGDFGATRTLGLKKNYVGTAPTAAFKVTSQIKSSFNKDNVDTNSSVKLFSYFGSKPEQYRGLNYRLIISDQSNDIVLVEGKIGDTNFQINDDEAILNIRRVVQLNDHLSNSDYIGKMMVLQLFPDHVDGTYDYYEIHNVNATYAFASGIGTTLNPEVLALDSWEPESRVFLADPAKYWVSVDADVDIVTDADSLNYWREGSFNKFKDIIGREIIRKAFAVKLDLNQTAELLSFLQSDEGAEIDLMIVKNLITEARSVRMVRTFDLVESIDDSLTLDESEEILVPQPFSLMNSDNIPEEIDYYNSIYEKLIKVDDRFYQDNFHLIQKGEINLQEIEGEFFMKMGDKFKDVTGKMAQLKDDALSSMNKERLLEQDFIRTLAEYSDLSDRLVMGDYLTNKEHQDLEDLQTIISAFRGQLLNEYTSLSSDVLLAKLEDAIDDLVDDDNLLELDNAKEAFENKIDGLIASVSDSIDSADETLSMFQGAYQGARTEAAVMAQDIKDRYNHMAAQVKVQASSYFNDLHNKWIENKNALSDALDFSLSNLLNKAVTYKDSGLDFLTKITGVGATDASSLGWQDSFMFTPASNLALATGTIATGLSGAISTAFSLLGRVVTGVADKVRGAITSTFVDGVSFKKKKSGFETLSLQAAFKYYDLDYFDFRYTELAEKMAGFLDGHNKYYAVAQIGPVYIFIQDGRDAGFIVTANPKIMLRDNTELESDWDFATTMAHSIIHTLTFMNKFQDKLIQMGLVTDKVRYNNTLSEEYILKDILARAKGKTAAKVWTKRGIFAGIGVAIGAALILTGVGSVAGIALVAGATAVGVAMTGEAVNQTKIERLESDSVYANSVIDSADLASIWTDYIPTSVIDIGLNFMNQMSNAYFEAESGNIYVNLCHDGTGDAVDMTDVLGESAVDKIGYLPFLIMAGAPKFKYRLVSDTERLIKSGAAMVAIAVPVAMMTAKAVSGTMAKVKRKKIAKLATNQRTKDKPHKDDFTTCITNDKGVKVCETDESAYKAAMKSHNKQLIKWNAKAQRLSATSSSGGGINESLKTVASIADAEHDNNNNIVTILKRLG